MDNVNYARHFIFLMRYLFLICTLFTGFYVHGQSPKTDSLLFTRNGEHRLDFLFRATTLMSDSARSNIGTASLFFDTEKRDYRTAQQAQHTNTVGMDARGISYLGGKTVVSGIFSYHKVWQDSLSYSLSGLEDNSLPTYYFVQKAGQFERQTYRANAHIGHELSQDWRVDAALDYTHHWATRSIDPRMDFYSMAWLFKPSLSYNLHIGKISLQPVYGKGTAQTDISYKHDPYNSGDQYPEYHYVNNYGYGSIDAQDSIPLRQYDRYLGLQSEGAIRLDRYELWWNVGYMLRNIESTHDSRHLDNYFVVQTFDLETFHMDFLLSQLGDNAGSLRLGLVHRSGVDGAYYNGQNYFLTQWEGSLSLSKTVQQASTWPKEFGIDLKMAYDERDDAASSHYAERAGLDIALPISIAKRWRSQRSVRWQVIPAIRIPIRNTLYIPVTQVNRFSTGIAYPEFYYYAVKSVNLQSRITFLTRSLWKNTPVGFFALGDFTKPFGFKGELYGNSLRYTGSNLRLRIGVNFYL